MLVLSRKLHQQIVIEVLNIRITVLRIGGNRVQLGIEAPSGVQISRMEMLEGSDDGSSEQTNLDHDSRPNLRGLPMRPIRVA